jgi:hypothetical protein
LLKCGDYSVADEVQAMRHITKDKGDLAVAQAIAHLLEYDIRVCMPLSEHLPFDFIAVMPDMKTLRRVQVKYRAARLGSVHIPFWSNYYDSKKIYSKPVNFDEIDTYAAYCPETQEIYYLRVADEIPPDAHQICIRVEPAKNNQSKGVRLGSDYINPLRIAPSVVSIALKHRERSALDEIALAKVQADLVAHEIQPSVPQSQFTPFDLIAVMPDMKTLRRVCVSYGKLKLSEFVDIYAVYQPEKKCIQYFRAEEIIHQANDMLTVENLSNPCRMIEVSGPVTQW